MIIIENRIFEKRKKELSTKVKHDSNSFPKMHDDTSYSRSKLHHGLEMESIVSIFDDDDSLQIMNTDL